MFTRSPIARQDQRRSPRPRMVNHARRTAIAVLSLALVMECESAAPPCTRYGLQIGLLERIYSEHTTAVRTLFSPCDGCLPSIYMLDQTERKKRVPAAYKQYNVAEAEFLDAVAKVIPPPKTGSISVFAIHRGWGLAHVKRESNGRLTSFGGSPPDGTLQELDDRADVRCGTVAVREDRRRTVLSVPVEDSQGKKVGELQMYLLTDQQ